MAHMNLTASTIINAGQLENAVGCMQIFYKNVTAIQYSNDHDRNPFDVQPLDESWPTAIFDEEQDCYLVNGSSITINNISAAHAKKMATILGIFAEMVENLNEIYIAHKSINLRNKFLK